MNEHEARVERLLEEIRDLLAEANEQRGAAVPIMNAILGGGIDEMLSGIRQGVQEAAQSFGAPIVEVGTVPALGDEDDEPTYHHECGGNVEVNLIGDDVYDIVMTCAGCGQRSHGIATINGGGK